MAKAGDKRRLEENKTHLERLKIAIAVANILFIGSRLLLLRNPILGWHGGAIALTTVLYTFCYSGIAAALAPHYSPSGELIFAGADLKMGGVLSYYHDVVYVAIFSQILGAYTNYGWLAMLTIPAYGLWALFSKVLLPQWSTPDEAPETEQDKKRREKRERQEARVQRMSNKRT